MSPESIFLVIISLFVFDFIFEQTLDYLNSKTLQDKLPKEAEGIYTEEKYKASIAYQRDQSSFGFVSAIFSFILSGSMLLFGGFGWLDSLLRGYFDNQIFLALAFFGVIFIVSDVLTLPFQYYSTFVIEEKHGFNKTTINTFIFDKIKGYLLGVVIGGALVYVLLSLIINMGGNFWLVFWAIATVLVLGINMFYTSLILPLFNKLTPLEDGELKTAIADYCQKEGFPGTKVFVIDGSKRSSKANAFFSGIGSQKKVVLYDTLINNHSIAELVAVLAHEVGHYKKKHIVQGFVASILQMGFMLFALSLFVFNPDMSKALGADQLAIHINLIAFGLLFAPVSMISGLIMNLVSRKNEFEADAFAAETFSGKELATALKKLSVDNLSNLTPHPLYVFFHYSHPPMLQRLKAMNQDK
jgi:STE24 endopeptidase